MSGYISQFEDSQLSIPSNNLLRGIFIKDDGTIFLKLSNGIKYQLSDVVFMTERFSEKEGVLKYPRPWQYSETGKVEEMGDIVLVSFTDGNVTNPIVLGSVVLNEKHAFFHEYTTEDFEKHKERWETENCIIEQSDDGAGEIVLDITARNSGAGNVTVNLQGIGDNGNITVNVSGTATVKADNKAIVDSPKIELGKDSTEPLVLGNKWKQLFSTHTHPTGTGPSGPPAQGAQAESVLSEQNTTL
jgi:hypothetical protein